MKLLKTNSKTYINRIQSAILDAIEFEDVELSNRQKIEYLIAHFESEANYPNNLRKFPNNQQRLADWLSGLPSYIHIPFSNYDILEFAKELHGVNELTEKQEDAILSNYWNHMAYHIFKLFAYVNKEYKNN